MRKVAHASPSHSTAARWVNPACSRPRAWPPAPAQISMHVTSPIPTSVELSFDNCATWCSLEQGYSLTGWVFATRCGASWGPGSALKWVTVAMYQGADGTTNVAQGADISITHPRHGAPASSVRDHRWLSLTFLVFDLAMIILDAATVGLALPAIVGDLG